MSQFLQQAQALIEEASQYKDNMNEAQKGGGGRFLPEGYAIGRLCEYIEFGNQPQEYEGKAKEPAAEFRLGFALVGKGYENDDGTPYVVRTFNIAESRNDKAKAFKLFKKLNWDGTKKNFAQLLGQHFLVKIVHVENKTTKKKSSRIDLDGFLPPMDQLSKSPYPVPELPEELWKLFLWDRPTMAGWDSLKIEGEKDDGGSKNYIQEQILAALNFDGSPLQQLLLGANIALPEAAPAAATPATTAATPAPVVTPVTEQAISMPSMPAV